MEENVGGKIRRQKLTQNSMQTYQHQGQGWGYIAWAESTSYDKKQ